MSRQCSILIPPGNIRQPENVWFSDVSREHRNKTFTEKDKRLKDVGILSWRVAYKE